MRRPPRRERVGTRPYGVVGRVLAWDKATVSGGDNPSGTIQFSVTDPNGHSTNVGSPVTVNGDGDYSAPSSVALALVGTYTWSASYSGDSLNSGARCEDRREGNESGRGRTGWSAACSRGTRRRSPAATIRRERFSSRSPIRMGTRPMSARR